MLPDYHIHTARCGHAVGRMEEYIARAVALGLEEIGFADHIPMYWLDKKQHDPELAMADEMLPEYVTEVERLRRAYPEISIKLGIEADYIPGFENEAREILSSYPFDYVLGSIHYIDGWGFDNPNLINKYNEININTLYRKYFKLVQQAVRSGLFDVLAHPDLIKKFGFKPTEDLSEMYAETAWVIAQTGVGIEINTAGLRAPVGEIYPSLILLGECRKQGVAVTTGSDAHAPEQVGLYFDKVQSLLKKIGYTEVLFFRSRQKYFKNF